MSLAAFLRDVDAALPQRLREQRLPGLALACIEEGEVAAVRCAGRADDGRARPVSPDTLFRVASVSKAVAAWAVMRLVERGVVELDAPVDRYLARWRLPPSPHDPTSVTVRRLLSHQAGISTAGIGRRPHDGRPVDVIDGLEARQPAMNAEQRRYYTRWGLPPDAPVRLERPPGSGFAYSNGGFAMLEAMIEDVTGRHYADHLSTEVLEPLGMRASGFDPLPPPLADATAQPFFEDGEPVEDWVPLSRAAGGLWSTIGDLATFARAGLPGPHGEPPGRGVIAPGSVAAMHQRQCAASVEAGVAFDSGLGHFLHTDASGTLHVSHTGGFSGWRSVFWIVPAWRAGICVLVNSDGGNGVWQQLLREWAVQRGAA